ncbi:MAG TPA: single-stranded-DNA-specific exonuclease RecJ [Gammaproteobacteria bacterium]
MKGKTVIRRRPCAAIPEGYPADLHPVLARVYAARNVTSADQLHHGLALLPSHIQLKGIDAAVALLVNALEQRQHILVVGDFDADGATSTALAARALRAMGAAHVDFLVPNRFEYGYGLTPEIVAVAAQQKPDLIVTVDNGISSIQGVEAAHALGIKVLVTDHHLPAALLPPAEAIVNPNQPGDSYPSKNLAGVGVIFYVMLALRAALRERGWFTTERPEPNLAQLLDLVALGTVADVVVLDHTNRILVAQGLARIRSGQACAGIRALLEIAGRQPLRIVSADLGFAVGPRLNAAGRLADMTLGIRCLLSDDEDEARELAQQLDQINRERRATEDDMHNDALMRLQTLFEADVPQALPFGLCLYDPAWHQGVIGILASRIKERLHRPVIIFTDSGEEEIKGSARSVSGVHIRDVLDAIAKRYPGLLSKFGGHAMAAGMTLRRSDFEHFHDAFDAEVRRHLSAEDLRGVVLSDGELLAEEIDLTLAEMLRQAVPWGQGFPEPLFDGEFEVAQQRVVGERHLKLKLRWPGSRRLIDAIAFHADLDNWPEQVQRVQTAYRLDVNEFRGERSVQLIVEHLRPIF